MHRDPPADHIARSHLKVDRSLPEQSARSVLAIYKENIDLAKLKADSKPLGTGTEAEAGKGEARKGDPQHNQSPPKDPPRRTGLALMDGERIVFTEESDPQRYVKLVASGEVDETLLDAITDYVKRQRKRLGLSEEPKPS